MTGFIGPLTEGDDFDGQCPVCRSDPYDPTCHHPACPTICPRPILDDHYRTTHLCPQTDMAVAQRMANMLGLTGPLDLPTPPVPESWKVSERLAAWDQGRQPAAWAARDPEPVSA